MANVMWRFAEAPLLVIVSLYGLFEHRAERSSRNEVLASGTETTARVVKTSGVESVIIQWTDSSGKQRSSTAWTGKPFARLASTGQEIVIKYRPDSTLDPVILSQVEERERTNQWWIAADAWAAFAMFVLCGVVLTFLLFRKKAESKADLTL